MYVQKGKLKAVFLPSLQSTSICSILSVGSREGVIRGVSAEFSLKLRDILFLSKVHAEDSRPVSFQHRTMLSPYV